MRAVNERDLELTCKIIERFSSVSYPVKMVEIGHCYSVACTVTYYNLLSV